MAQAKSLDAKVNSLTRLVEKGFAAVATDIGRLPTRNDVSDIVREETKNIRDEVASIRRDLEELARKVDNIVGLYPNLEEFEGLRSNPPACGPAALKVTNREAVSHFITTQLCSCEVHVHLT